MEYSGAGGKLIHEKNQKQKISWHCPFKLALIRRALFSWCFSRQALSKQALGY